MPFAVKIRAAGFKQAIPFSQFVYISDNIRGFLLAEYFVKIFYLYPFMPELTASATALSIS